MGLETERILIAGAGPVGLTAAMLLQQKGLPFTLLEKCSRLPQDLRASTFHPPSLDMLDQLGVAAPLITRGRVSPTWQVRIHPGGERAVFDLGILSDSTGHPYRLQCRQAILCDLLAGKIEAAGGDIRMGMELVSFAQSEDSVQVTARDPTGALHEYKGAFLIAADGAHSAVRKNLGLAFTGKTYPETTILATTDFPFAEHLEGLSNVNYVWKKDGTFSLLRLPDLWRCSLYPDGEETLEDALAPASIRRKLQEIVPAAASHPVREVRPYRIHMRIVDKYRHGRILLAGDAAHMNSPSGGMGMNGGIHDAFELVATLLEVLDGKPLEHLDRYSRRRRPVALEQILAQSDRNRRRMQERDPEKRRAILEELRRIAGDAVEARRYLLQTSMFEGLRKAAEIA